jgi:Uma2 family endonuclease
MTTKAQAMIEDLYRVPGKAEIVNGELVLMSLTGGLPGYAADEIYASLRMHARATRSGWAVADNKAFVVNLPHRKSFSPDAAYYVGPPPTMRFYEGAPVFAVEVRSEGDYSPTAEEDLASKPGDYFAAGTQVVWDVDLRSDDVIRCYRASDPEKPVVFRRGEIADAEPAVPGWTMRVDDLFPQQTPE